VFVFSCVGGSEQFSLVGCCGRIL